ncbi:MAG TPA: class I SAM-dependent methyltransferase [Candidatus Limnocylindrales bacterium]|nr:class I SAM-dependent methyltransferase [Candidatus Limnocylindrales bacterium]
MPFREQFDCLWCGRAWTASDANALEGWSQLCPDCLGRAGDNGFLRARLRAAIEERGRATATSKETASQDRTEPGDPDDWYLRRGLHSHSQIDDMAFRMELDAATLWLDGLPIRGRIVELAAGTGWWSPLLAGKGELWVYDASGPALDRARERLVAHNLRAHLHVREPWAPPEPPPADALVAARLLGTVPSPHLPERLSLARSWLAPGGLLVVVDEPAPGGGSGLDPLALKAALEAANFVDVRVGPGGRFLALVSATATSS